MTSHAEPTGMSRTADPGRRALPPAVFGGVVEAQSRSVPSTTVTWSRLGRVDLRSAVRYLAVWAVALCAVLLAVLVLGYVLLSALGVMGSISKALAIVSGGDTRSGLIPALQPQHVLPLLALSSVVLSALAFVASLAMVCVHNAATSLTGGLRVRLRPEAARPVRPRTR